MSHIRRAIKAEIMMRSANNSHAQQYELTTDEENQGEKETRDSDEMDWDWCDTNQRKSVTRPNV